jgi:hypothetical protein
MKPHFGAVSKLFRVWSLFFDNFGVDILRVNLYL